MKKEMKCGAVTTRKIGSECQFEICPMDEWNEMTDDEQSKALIEAMWDSGIIDVYPID